MPHVFTFHARQVFASALPQSSIPWTALLSGKAARGSGKAEPGSKPPCYKAGSASSGTSVFKKKHTPWKTSDATRSCVQA